MCGIAGIAGSDNVTERLVDAIQNLEYRGYDSCGVALISGGKKSRISIKKNIGGVEEVSNLERFTTLKGKTGIAHTRWATHGGVTKENAHPHLSCDKLFAAAHNGIISNYAALRKSLIKEGHKFLSETDTETIVHLMEKFYARHKDVEKAFLAMLGKLEGTYAILLISTEEPDRIYCARQESPLIIGKGNGSNYIGSDFNAFISHTKNAVIMEDGEYAIVTANRFIHKNITTGKQIKRSVTQITWNPEMAQKGGFPHFMLKEMYDQPKVVTNALDIDKESIQNLAKVMSGKKKIYFTGVGTTFYVAQLAQYYMANYAGVTPQVVSSDEFRFLARVDEDTVVIAASQSGETYDTLNALKFSKNEGAVTSAIVNVMGSSMARMVDHLILQGSGPEICVISTKAALAQMLIFARLSLELGLIKKMLTKKEYDRYNRELRTLPGLIDKLLNEKSGFVHNIAKAQSGIRHWLFLGRGRYYPVARESALKMKEVSYVHAEGMPSGFLKHGTIALVDDDLNSVVFMPTNEEKELYDLALSSAEEIRARNGYVLGILPSGGSGKGLPFSDVISLPKSAPFVAPFVEMVAAQLLSYYTAVTLKRNIDKPRALAKSVTVA